MKQRIKWWGTGWYDDKGRFRILPVLEPSKRKALGEAHWDLSFASTYVRSNDILSRLQLVRIQLPKPKRVRRVVGR